MKARLLALTSSTAARSSRWPNRKRRPSAISARRLRTDGGSVAAPSARNRPLMDATRPALAPKEAASARNGSQAARAKAALPAGGPASCWPTVREATSWPLARSRRRGSRPTTATTMAWAAFSNRVWPAPTRNPATASSGMLAQPASTATVRAPTTSARAASTIHITRRRSRRSTSAPAGRANSSQGSQPAKVTTDTASGSRVSSAASSGRAARYMPSPKAETVEAAHNRWKGVPSPPVGSLPDRDGGWCWLSTAPRVRLSGGGGTRPGPAPSRPGTRPRWRRCRRGRRPPRPGTGPPCRTRRPRPGRRGRPGWGRRSAGPG